MDINQANESITLDTGYMIAHQRRESLLKTGITHNIQSSLRKDAKTIGLLMFLYFLQGLPMGLASGVSILLTDKKVSYSDQSTFSFVWWPFSLKFIWAPLIDSIYVRRFGRRKSWLVSVQLLLGVVMFPLGSYCQELVKNIQQSENGLSRI
jgi:hypothetical protein